jgi:uncharacterized protein (TIGR02246 family)
MFRRLSIPTLATLTCLLLWCGCGSHGGLPEADRAAIRQAQDDYVRLTNARDFKGLAALYAEDAVILPPGRPAIQGRAAIQAFMDGSPPSANFQLQVIELDGRGNLAYSREIAVSTMNPPGTTPRIVREKVIAIWRRQADGSWKVLRDIWNAEQTLSN